MWMTREKMIETLGLALKDRAPRMYQELKNEGTLREFLAGREEVIRDEAEQAHLNEHHTLPETGMERFQEAHTRRMRAYRVALEGGIADLPTEEQPEEEEEIM